MNVDIRIPAAPNGRVYLTWAPVRAEARLTNIPAGTGNVAVTLRDAGTAGRILLATTRTRNGAPTLALTLPGSGAPVSFFIGGRFGSPSVAYGDAAVEAVRAGGTVLGRRTLMVRVRKSAVGLTTAERGRFLAALGTLNGSGAGRFRDFRAMHTNASSPHAHGNSGFLPWHRAYLLDFERELQAIDPTVALPYWRWDRPSAALFTNQYLGVSDANDRVRFAPGHPLGNWTTNGVLGILRRVDFNPAGPVPGPMGEAATLALAAPQHRFANFLGMEGNPHGSAHVSFDRWVSDIDTAAKDPLFFLLHCNVDRLWAKWQFMHGRSNPNDPAAYAPPVPNRVGHRLNDTMWPWNGTSPPTPVGGGFAASPLTAAPGATPQVRQMIDYQAQTTPGELAFGYDDVPFGA